MTERPDDRRQIFIDWWIDGLIKRGFPMMKNTIQVDGREVLTDGCIHAQARGARLVEVKRVCFSANGGER